MFKIQMVLARESIPYRKLYRFDQQYDIFRIPINTSIPFRVYCYFILYYILYIYIYTHPHAHTHTTLEIVKKVNTVPEIVLVWSLVRYISDTGQYRYTISSKLLFYIIIIIIILLEPIPSMFFRTSRIC